MSSGAKLSRMWPTTSSASRVTGVRNRWANRTAAMVSRYMSATLEAASTTAGWSPWVPQRACMTSPCDGAVGRPVDGPARITSTMSSGASTMMA